MRNLQSFVNAHWDGHSPLLVGYSGGPDSKALLYGLLESHAAILHVAHVDHGWREESAVEAEKIRKEIEALGLPFHTVRLNPSVRGNKEAIAREDRLLFFQELKKKFSFQACFLAHHRGDLAETVLKRVLEGAHVSFLGGMKEVSFFGQLPLWRPLLSVSRSEILAFLKKNNLDPLIDSSNFDPAYLRARMRMEIFPHLQEQFGKGIEENLSLLSSRSLELNEYLDRKIQEVLIEEGPWGKFLSFLGLEKIEARHLLQTLLPRGTPRGFLESILDALLTKKANCRFSSTLFVDRGSLFLLSLKPPQFKGPVTLSLGKQICGNWQIEVSQAEGLSQEPNWKNVWTGSFSVLLSRGVLSLPLPGICFKKLWSEKKIPPFLRFQIPVFLENNMPVKEFLSGKASRQISPVFKVAFSITDS